MLQPLQDTISVFLSYIPQLIGAIVILIVGYVIARILQALITRVLQSIGFENWMERGGIKRFFDQTRTQETPSSILGKLVFWFVFIIAVTLAANALGIQQISGFLNQLIALILSIFVAVLILLLAGILANFVSGLVRGATGSGVLGSVAVRHHHLRSLRGFDAAWDSCRAHGAYVPDRTWRGGFGAGDSVWYRWPGGSEGHRREGLQPAPGGNRRLRRHRRRKRRED